MEPKIGIPGALPVRHSRYQHMFFGIQSLKFYFRKAGYLWVVMIGIVFRNKMVPKSGLRTHWLPHSMGSNLVPKKKKFCPSLMYHKNFPRPMRTKKENMQVTLTYHLQNKIIFSHLKQIVNVPYLSENALANPSFAFF